jgi:hypothetical protein
MPKIEDPIKIANGYTAIPGRTPFNLHTFQGANSFMVQLIKNNKTALGVSAPDANFDSTLKAINTMLREQTLDITTHHDTTLNDTIYFSLQLLNKAGHKFPSGYPSRRAVVQFIALKANGDTLFASGLFDQNFEVVNIAPSFLPHYEMINDATQTQIYEMVMGDVNGDRTTVLERGATHLKDNRIPPLGFTTTHFAYDTCKIAGNALVDPNFNKIAGIEGSGADIIKYNIPLQGYYGSVTVLAKVYYQSVPPGWLSEMQNYSSAEIDTFMNMYAAADKSPVLIAEDSILNIPVTVGLNEVNNAALRIHPNPTYDGKVSIEGIATGTQITIYNAAGQQVNVPMQKKANSISLELPAAKGIYYLILSGDQKKQLKKIIRL